MKNAIAFLATVALWAVCATAYSEYGVTDTGTWPKSCPSELEPLRQQASTFEGPLAPDRHDAIRFTQRDEFESAWPHILKVKSKGARLVLVRGANFLLGEHAKAGVVIHTPPLARTDNPATGEAPLPGGGQRRRETWREAVAIYRPSSFVPPT